MPTKKKTNNQALQHLTEPQREKLKKKKQPQFHSPMLATLTDQRFSDDDWIFERKLDGERCLAIQYDHEVQLYSRNQKSLNVPYPEIVNALESQTGSRLMVDGELVAFEGSVTSFSRLQDRMQIQNVEEAKASKVAVYYYVFDILHWDGFELTDLPLRIRKKILRRALQYEDPIRFTQHRNGQGESFYQEACRKGWEGLIAKRADSSYCHGRSRDWLKFKCVNQQEFVIGGYTDPEGERIGFGALLIGHYENGDLIYAGKVGTGYDDETLEKLGNQLARHQRKQTPFKDRNISGSGIHWVQPKLVAEVAFTEWTEEGRLRHPRFLGLRRDKSPKQVHGESRG